MHVQPCASHSAVPRSSRRRKRIMMRSITIKRKHSILHPQDRRVRRRSPRRGTTPMSRLGDVCARFAADHPGTQPSRDALYRLVKGCQTVEPGCDQVAIVAFVRSLQSGDASTFAEFLAGCIDPAGTGNSYRPNAMVD
jgi:hypothetical protein